MNSKLVRLALLLLFASPCWAQWTYTAPAEDTYLGLTAVPCTNTNTAFKLTTVTVLGATQAVFCTPLGHVLPFTRGDIGFDATLVAGTDESGNSYLSYITAKYGNTTNWIQESIPRIKSFGLNTLATYVSINAKPARSAQKMPFVAFQIMSAYSQTTQSTTWGSAPVKNLISITSPQWAGYTSVGGGVADYPDPNWATLSANVLTHDTGAIELGSSSAANKGFLLGFSYDDSDNTHCLGAGNQAATAPAGNNDFRCGYLPFFLASLNWANSSRGVIYQDGTVYWKKKWRDNLAAKYGTIGALNAAWGGGAAFTTFDSSGTCVGTVPLTCASSVGEDLIGTGNGSTVSFTATLSHLPISKWSMGTFVAGTLVGGGASGAFNNDGTVLYGTTIISTNLVDVVNGSATVTLHSGSTPQFVTGGSWNGASINLAGTIYTISSVSSTTSLTLTANYTGSTANSVTATYSFMNYTTGAVKLLFTAAGTPTNGATITARYVQNGWGIGTGLMDEDCRSAHSAYCGTGSGTDPVQLTNLPASVKTDVNDFTQYISGLYSSTIKNSICAWAGSHGFTGCPMYLGPTVLGTWTMVPDPYVMAGFCGNADAWMYAAAQGDILQTTLDGVNTACPNQKLFTVEYKVASRDSEFQWVNSSTTHVGTTVTITVAVPNKLNTNDLYDVNCADPTYNRLQFRAQSTTATTFVYIQSPAPTGASTTCTLYFDDNNVGGFSNQTTRGADFQSSVDSLTAKAYTATGFHPYVGYWSWEHFSDWSDKHPWGYVTIRDNLYTPAETSNAVVLCQAPNPLNRNCGGELSPHGPPYGNYIAAVATANTSIDAYFAGAISAPAVSLSPTSLSFNNQAVGLPSSAKTIVLTNTGTATLSISSIALLTGTNYSETNTCGTTLAPSSSCNINVTFSPISVASPITDSVVVTTNAASSPDSASTTGNGVTATIPSLMLSFQPLPIQNPIPVLTQLSPASSYLSSKGFSQDGITFLPSLTVTLLGSGFVSGTVCNFDGTPITCTCGSTTSCVITIPSSLTALPTARTSHSITVSNPVVVVPPLN